MRRIFAAGGVVYKLENSAYLWLVIKPRRSEKYPSVRYQLPKGQLEENEKTEQAAIREVYEETGIHARILQRVGYSKFPMMMDGQKVFKIVTYYLMEFVSGELTENEEVEELYWLPLEEAIKKLTTSDGKKIMREASKILSGTISPS